MTPEWQKETDLCSDTRASVRASGKLATTRISLGSERRRSLRTPLLSSIGGGG